MSKHPRTDKSRNSAFEKWQEHRIDNPEISLSEYMLKSLDNLCRELETELSEANASLAAVFSIIQDTLKELPVGHIPRHMPESIPDRVKHYVQECTRMDVELEELKQ